MINISKPNMRKYLSMLIHNLFVISYNFLVESDMIHAKLLDKKKKRKITAIELV